MITHDSDQFFCCRDAFPASDRQGTQVFSHIQLTL